MNIDKLEKGNNLKKRIDITKKEIDKINIMESAEDSVYIQHFTKGEHIRLDLSGTEKEVALMLMLKKQEKKLQELEGEFAKL